MAGFVAATRSAAARQSGLAPVFAELHALVASPEIPLAVRQSASRVLAAPANLDQASGENLRQAVAKSGLFLEARLAADGRVAPPIGDLKIALLALRQTLQSWLDTTPAVPITVSVPKGEAALTNFQADVKTPPPPYRGAPTGGQQPMSAQALEGTPPAEIARALLAHTDGALARQVLMQVASLPDMPNVTQAPSDATDAHWNLEIPFATPQGTAIAHFEIARDARKTFKREVIPAAWRANFSLDFEPMGPVHAQIALTGKRAAVRIWAERSDTAAVLRDGAAELTRALREASLDTADVIVRDGAPPRPLKPNPGPLPGSRFMTALLPGSLAVALAYEAPGAPRVVAKGDGELGRRIIETAHAHGVPVEENAGLAAALSGVELDDEIPVELYKAAAEVIGFVLRLSKQR